jgi:predicted nicotinamide N-methyase
MMTKMAVVFVFIEHHQHADTTFLVLPRQITQVTAFSFSSSSSSSSPSFCYSQRKIKTKTKRTGAYSSLSSSTSSSKLSSSSSLLMSQQQEPSFILHVDDPTTLTTGTLVLPPMVSVPCTISATTTTTGILKEIIKPPNVDELYDWYIEVRNEHDADPSWGVVWPTAVSLCNYLLINPQIVINKNVIELGSGLSICGLISASIGAQNVIVSDREQFALHCALSSAACNKLSNVKGVILDWCDTKNNAELDNTADVILASDVLYDMDTVDAFANVCKRLLKVNKDDGVSSGTILVTDPKIERTVGARERFKNQLQLNNNDDSNSNSNSNSNDISSGVRIEVTMEEIGLPLPCGVGDDDGGGSGRTLDGKDHAKKMKEETVLIRCTIRTTSPTTQ